MKTPIPTNRGSFDFAGQETASFLGADDSHSVTARFRGLRVLASHRAFFPVIRMAQKTARSEMKEPKRENRGEGE